MELFVCKLYESKLHHTVDAVREHMLLSCSKPESMPRTSDACDINRTHIQNNFVLKY